MSGSGEYSIGAAARASGVSTHTLRKWEQRYGAITPERTSGGARRFSASDVERLFLLKELVDNGHPISAIAQKGADELRELLDASGHQQPDVPARMRIAVAGYTLPSQIVRHVGELPAVEVIETAAEPKDLEGMGADVVVLELASLTEHTVDVITEVRRRTGADAVVVLYALAPHALARSLADERTAVMRLPVVYRELQRTITALGVAPPLRDSNDLPEHRFSRQVLARIATTFPELECECPRHVAELIFALTDFEQYSANCEADKPADAAIHRELKRAAAISRSLFEGALVSLAAHENISLDERD